MYELEHISQWTTYTVGTYASVEECERDCEGRYGRPYVKFERDTDGVLKAVIYNEEYVVLKLYERQTEETC